MGCGIGLLWWQTTNYLQSTDRTIFAIWNGAVLSGIYGFQMCLGPYNYESHHCHWWNISDTCMTKFMTPVSHHLLLRSWRWYNQLPWHWLQLSLRRYQNSFDWIFIPPVELGFPGLLLFLISSITNQEKYTGRSWWRTLIIKVSHLLQISMIITLDMLTACCWHGA